MMDSFDHKRKMVQALQDALKKSAGDEMSMGGAVNGGKPAPMPPKGLEQTKMPQAHPSVKGDVSPDMQKAPSGERETLAPEASVTHPHRKDSFEHQAPVEPPTMAKGGMVDLTKDQSLMEPTSDDMRMSEGGLAGTDMSETDEPNRLTEPKGPSDDDQSGTALGLLPEAPQDEEGQEDSRQTLANENMEHEDEDNNSSAFSGFFPRKKKKS